VSFREACRFAAGALRGHRLRAGLSLLGVAIGVASVILLTALGEGARIYVRGEFLSLGSNLLVVYPGKNETTGGMPMVGLHAPRELTLDDAYALARRLRQVKAAAPIAMGQANARVADRNRTVNVAGTTAGFQEVRSLHLRYGRYLPADESQRGERVAVIGGKLQAELFLGENPIGRSLRLGQDRYRVIGVLTPRGVSLGTDLDEVVHIPVDQAMRMFNVSGVTQVMVEVRAHEEIPAARAGVFALLKERHDGHEDVTVVTQDAVLASFGKILAVLTAALGGIAAISLTVAGVGIMNVMLVSVSERTREIGLLKAVGVTRGQVLAVFLVEAAILSTAGGALGVATGLLAAQTLGALYPTFPVSPPQWAVVGASAVSVAVGLVFGALPARRAAALDPVMALAPR
jgi:putative ABC transport system permease protein